MENHAIEWDVYEDNKAHGEDKSGVYDTFGGTLYFVADGASSHDGKKTGKDVVDLMDVRLREYAKKMNDWRDMEDTFYMISRESSEVNKGAYAAFAAILNQGNRFYPVSAGDVSIIKRDNKGNLYQILPLDLRHSLDEAIKMARKEIGTRVDKTVITKDNYMERANQIANHSLYNAIGMGDDFFLRGLENFRVSPGERILIASDGITDVLMKPQRDQGIIPESDAEGLYNVLDASTPEEAKSRLEEVLVDTQIDMLRKGGNVKKDDRTGLLIFVNNPEVRNYTSTMILPKERINQSLR